MEKIIITDINKEYEEELSSILPNIPYRPLCIEIRLCDGNIVSCASTGFYKKNIQDYLGYSMMTAKEFINLKKKDKKDEKIGKLVWVSDISTNNAINDKKERRLLYITKSGGFVCINESNEYISTRLYAVEVEADQLAERKIITTDSSWAKIMEFIRINKIEIL